MNGQAVLRAQLQSTMEATYVYLKFSVQYKPARQPALEGQTARNTGLSNILSKEQDLPLALMY